MSKSIRDQLLGKDLLKLAGAVPKLHKAYRIRKCGRQGLSCSSCTSWQYRECLESYGK